MEWLIDEFREGFQSVESMARVEERVEDSIPAEQFLFDCDRFLFSACFPFHINSLKANPFIGLFNNAVHGTR
ncbi:hypothetical protein KJ765_03315 [Candidatus Micrarchaeota archaeon]|nr:hypothetical protein [Candidatus Micrarchaeota archaeon]